ncbi:hypothetical protein [Trichocoleus sp. FACHB-262]|uniref:hypothetical protein n=1 Tax=Trichocoleus sp. FACHB-262 TaxID=2692869 RepID=UPI0016830E5B|nr:hypothetical protein [Trichocoleus sp. FACHB-262]MBD2121775.1 hypothetical protein [Trichocoleus sp. FACHB-262]
MRSWSVAKLGILILCGLNFQLGAIATDKPPSFPVEQRPSSPITLPGRAACPSEFQPVVALLLRDLPGYMNRVHQRLFRRDRSTTSAPYVLLTSPPDFEPLALGPGVYQSASSPKAEGVHQVFFTTLERQYTAGKIIQLQGYHWVFLTQTVSGWRLAMMFSHFGPYPATRPPSPPENSTQGVTGQAIRAWLRDCRAGRIRPL